MNQETINTVINQQAKIIESLGVITENVSALLDRVQKLEQFEHNASESINGLDDSLNTTIKDLAEIHKIVLPNDPWQYYDHPDMKAPFKMNVEEVNDLKAEGKTKLTLV